jgi:RimJ/RimL family protein N-acetyltransferase
MPATHTAEIRELTRADRNGLLRMYDGFEPLGVAQGLPPRSSDARRDWIDQALAEDYNVGALDESGQIVGHVFLAVSGPKEVELAAFVHQDWRQRRIGTALVARALEHARRAGQRRVWALVASENIPAVRLLKNAGFRSAGLTFPVIELELLIPGRPREPRSGASLESP